MQIMVALRVFASAGFRLSLDIGDRPTFGISKVTVWRTVHSVVNVLAGPLNRYVEFERRGDAEVTKGKCYEMAGFHNVIGCIDAHQ